MHKAGLEQIYTCEYNIRDIKQNEKINEKIDDMQMEGHICDLIADRQDEKDENSQVVINDICTH